MLFARKLCLIDVQNKFCWNVYCKGNVYFQKFLVAGIIEIKQRKILFFPDVKYN